MCVCACALHSGTGGKCQRFAERVSTWSVVQSDLKGSCMLRWLGWFLLKAIRISVTKKHINNCLQHWTGRNCRQKHVFDHKLPIFGARVKGTYPPQVSPDTHDMGCLTAPRAIGCSLNSLSKRWKICQGASANLFAATYKGLLSFFSSSPKGGAHEKTIWSSWYFLVILAWPSMCCLTVNVWYWQ